MLGHRIEENVSGYWGLEREKMLELWGSLRENNLCEWNNRNRENVSQEEILLKEMFRSVLKKERARTILRILWGTDGKAKISLWTGGFWKFYEKEILQQELSGQGINQTSSEQRVLSNQSKKALEKLMRKLWQQHKPSSPPQGQEYSEQQFGEFANFMCQLSQQVSLERTQIFIFKEESFACERLMWVPPTNASEYGFLHGTPENWPTPVADDTSMRTKKYAQGGTPLSMRVGEKEQAKSWPTPTTQEIEHDEMELTEKGRRLSKDGQTSHSVGLADSVRLQPQTKPESQKSWPTPTCMDTLPSRSFEAMKRQATTGGRKNRKLPGNLRERIDPLMVQAYEEAIIENNPENKIKLKKFWSTPTANDSKKGDSPSERARHTLGLEVQVKSWPTPTANEDAAGTPDGKMQWMLTQAAKSGCSTRTEYEKTKRDKESDDRKWPTPTSSDRHGISPNYLYRKSGKSRENDRLDCAVEFERLSSFPTPCITGMGSGSGNCEKVNQLFNDGKINDVERRSMRAGNGGQLNPDWVEGFIMGWPYHWTRLEPMDREVFESWKRMFWKFGAVSEPMGLNVSPESEPEESENDLLSYLREQASVAEEEQRFLTEGEEAWQRVRFQTLAWDIDPADVGALSRVGFKIPNRTNRLKAIGNGQVPQTASRAFEILFQRMLEEQE